MWWTGNSCCFIGFCGTFLVLSGSSGDLAGPPRGAIIILPWRTNPKVEGSPVDFILRFGSGTNNVHSWGAQDTQERCEARQQMCAQEVDKMNISWSHSCIFTCTLEGVSLCASICQCIHMPLLMEHFPGEKSQEFKVQVQISLWWYCLYGETSKGWGDLGGAGAPAWKNHSWRLIREDVWKAKQELRSKTQKGLQRLAVQEWRCKKQNVSVRGAWREEREINEWVWRAKERRIARGSGLSLSTLPWGDHSSLCTVCMHVCIYVGGVCHSPLLLPVGWEHQGREGTKVR